MLHCYYEFCEETVWLIVDCRVRGAVAVWEEYRSSIKLFWTGAGQDCQMVAQRTVCGCSSWWLHCFSTVTAASSNTFWLPHHHYLTKSIVFGVVATTVIVWLIMNPIIIPLPSLYVSQRGQRGNSLSHFSTSLRYMLFHTFKPEAAQYTVSCFHWVAPLDPVAFSPLLMAHLW